MMLAQSGEVEARLYAGECTNAIVRVLTLIDLNLF